MDYTLKKDSLTVNIGSNVYIDNGKYFEETDNHKAFYEMCLKLDICVRRSLPYGYIHFKRKQSESSIEAEIKIYSKSGIGKNLQHFLMEDLLDNFFNRTHLSEIKNGNTLYYDNNDNYYHFQSLCCPNFLFTDLFIKKEYKEYKEYLSTPEWIVKRNLALKIANYKCVKCGKKENLNVHHLNYNNIGQELQGDLLVVCNSCHTNFHV